MPRVSVIIPVYNGAGFVASAVDSVLGQTARDLEVIVVDDGSTDSTAEVLEALAKRDARVRVRMAGHTGKPAMVRNIGLGLATGEFVALLDADDLYHPEKIARQLAAFARLPEAGALFHDYARFVNELPDAPTPELRSQGYVGRVGARFRHVQDSLYAGTPDFPVTMALVAVGMITCSVMFRRSRVGAELRFPEHLTVAEDIDLYFRIAHRAPVGYLDEVLCYRRTRAGSLSNATPKTQAAADMLATHVANFDRLKGGLAPEDLRRYRRVVADHWYDLGYCELRDGRAAEARRAFAASFRAVPRPLPALDYMKSFVPRGAR